MCNIYLSKKIRSTLFLVPLINVKIAETKNNILAIYSNTYLHNNSYF